MPWNPPATWSLNQLVTAADLNAQLRDNANYVHSGKPGRTIRRNNGGNYVTTSLTFVDMDATNLSIALNTTTGRVLVAFSVLFVDNSAGQALFDVAMDGVRLGGTLGLVFVSVYRTNAVLPALILTDVPNGSHTFRLQWCCTYGTVTAKSDAQAPLIFTVAEW